jgi:acetyltransferase-like isoleucine patch superfamily enzyme
MENRRHPSFDFSKLKKFISGIASLLWPIPVPFGLWLLNIIVQRIFLINGNVRWMVHYTSKVTNPRNIHIGKNVNFSFAVSGGCYIQALNGVYIGDYTIFAPGVKIISANHIRGELAKWHKAEPIRIGRNCWLGVNVVILPGVSLGDDCVVGAGAVVTKSFPAGSILGGVPAKLMKSDSSITDAGVEQTQA